MYSLSSRYYNPEIGRFINADDTDTIGATEGLITSNLFAYCANNPVNMTDEGGYWPSWGWNALKIGIGVLAITAVIVTGGAAAPLLIAVAVSTASGAAVGGAIGFATGGVEGFKKGLVDGACDGFMLGALGGAAAALKAGKLAKYTTGTAGQIGKIGEKLSGIIKNTKSFRMASGNMRIPDGLSWSKKLLQEVKNVKSLSLTSQLRDYMQFSKANGLAMELFIRPNTYLSGPLKQAIAQYGVTIKYLW